MARVKTIQNSFAGGKFTERLTARTDLAKYAVSAADIKRFGVWPHGGLYKTPGTYYLNDAISDTQSVDLWEFEHSETTAYIIEAAHHAFRFFADQAMVYCPMTNASVTNGTFDTDLTGWTDESTGASSVSQSNGYLALACGASGSAIANQEVTTPETTELHVIRFKLIGPRLEAPVVFNVGTTAGDDDIFSSQCLAPGCYAYSFVPNTTAVHVSFTCATANRTQYIDNVYLHDDEPLQLETPFSYLDLPDFQLTQSVDVLFMSHGNYWPHELARQGDLTWSVTEANIFDGPYLDEKSDITITPSATTGIVTLTASAALFKAEHVGSLWRIKETTTWGYVRIRSFSSATSVTAEVITTLGGTTASEGYREGAWSAHRGYPSAIEFFEERVYYGGHTDRPNRLWASKSIDYTNFAPTDSTEEEVLATTAIYEALSDGKLNAIRWFAPGRNFLAAGTTGAIHRIYGENGQPIEINTIRQSRELAHGVTTAQARFLNNSILFIERGGRKVREFNYVFAEDNYQARDLSLLANDITKRFQFKDFTVQKNPDNVLWFVREDGLLVSLTYDKEQDVWAWAEQPLGGTNTKVISVASVPSTVTNGDDLYLLVERTVDGQTKRFVEYMLNYEGFEEQEDWFFVDCGLSLYSETPVTQITGLAHLEGEMVAVAVDGAAHRRLTVENGEITLDSAASTIHVGLPYMSYIKTLPIDSGSELGTAQGAQKRIDSITINFLNTVGCRVNGQPLAFRSANMNMGVAVAPFTGQRKVPVAGGWDDLGQIEIEHDYPLQCQILSIITRLRTEEY